MPQAAKSTELTFEDALSKLESIVDTMEKGELPLEDLLNRYEEGSRLVKFCQDKLSAAEVRMQQLDPRPPEGPPASGAPADVNGEIEAEPTSDL